MAFGTRALSGPRLPPARGPATHLVVLCHGYGADGNDLIGLAPHWQRELPTVAFCAPNAPERCAGSPTGYQWFGIGRLDPHELQRGVESASGALNAYLDAELQRLDLAPDRLALVGFSQGTMMSLALGLARAIKPAAIVGYSGLLARGTALETLPPDAPPIFLSHGEADDLIPAEAMLASALSLGAAGAMVRWHISPGLGHGIGQDGMALGGRFLAAGLRGGLKRHETDICCRLG
jgi:phospholipase/carboxylesterase